MSWALIKYHLRRNWILWLVVTGVCVFYLAFIVFTKELLEDIMNSFLPEEMPTTNMNILEYTAVSFFVGVVFMFPMVYYIMVAWRMVGRAVDNTSMSAYLSSSMSRNNYITSSAVFLLGSIFAMFLLLFGLAAVFMVIMEPFNVLYLLSVTVITMLLTMMFAMASFFMSCLFAGAKGGLGAVIGIPAGCYVLFMIGGLVMDISWLEWFVYVTPFGWFDMAKIATGGGRWWVNFIYLAVTAALFVGSLFLFRRKQLSI